MPLAGDSHEVTSGGMFPPAECPAFGPCRSMRAHPLAVDGARLGFSFPPLLMDELRATGLHVLLLFDSAASKSASSYRDVNWTRGVASPIVFVARAVAVARTSDDGPSTWR